ncbi:MAG TPA: flagellar biosynthetic protein FliR [Kofleriaceae bacterium]|nr:flagellar biosynthetic protein FliR [Kofleriaceae bacterium]
MTFVVLALRGAAAIAVLTTLVGGIPRVVQAALAVAIGGWTALLVAPPHATFVGLPFAAQELAIGAALGVAAAVPLVAAATAGRLVDLAASRRARGPYATLFGVLAAAVFVGIDGHVAVVAAIVDSHRTLPALSASQPGALAVLAALVPQAVRLAVPWLVTAAVVEIAVGAGTRVAGRAAPHAPAAAAVPAALVMMTASLVATLAIAMAALFRAATA